MEHAMVPTSMNPLHGGLESAIPMGAIEADPPLDIEDADYSKTESEEIIGLPGDHYLNQMSKKGYHNVPEDQMLQRDSRPSLTQAAACSETMCLEKIRLYTTVNISEIREISLAAQSFQCKLRLYCLWQLDYESIDSSFAKYSDKARVLRARARARSSLQHRYPACYPDSDGPIAGFLW